MICLSYSFFLFSFSVISFSSILSYISVSIQVQIQNVSQNHSSFPHCSQRVAVPEKNIAKVHIVIYISETSKEKGKTKKITD